MYIQNYTSFTSIKFSSTPVCSCHVNSLYKCRIVYLLIQKPCMFRLKNKDYPFNKIGNPCYVFYIFKESCFNFYTCICNLLDLFTFIVYIGLRLCLLSNLFQKRESFLHITGFNCFPWICQM